MSKLKTAGTSGGAEAEDRFPWVPVAEPPRETRLRQLGFTLEGAPVASEVILISFEKWDVQWVSTPPSYGSGPVTDDITDEQETAEILADTETMALLRKARAEQAAGKLLRDDEVRKKR